MRELLLTLFALCVIPFSVIVNLKGRVWHMRSLQWRERKAVERRQSRVRARIERGSTSASVERALHNDFDDTCHYWWADRRPASNDTDNRNFGGASAPLDARRCVVCRPYAGGEEQSTLGYDETQALP